MMMHYKVIEATKRICAKRPHAILLVCSDELTKADYCIYLAKELSIISSQIQMYDAALSFGIDEIRSLQKTLARKLFGKEARLVIFNNAHKLSHPAQNALLKCIEEPGPRTMFVLCSNSSVGVLPTIASRCWLLNILPPTRLQYSNFHPNKSPDDINRAYILSDGWPANFELYFDKKDIDDLLVYSKDLLAQKLHTRLAMINDLTKKPRFSALEVLDMLLRLSQAAVHNNASSLGSRKIWTARSALLLYAIEDISMGSNSKIVLTDLWLNF